MKRILDSVYASLLLLMCLLSDARHFKRAFNRLINSFIRLKSICIPPSLWIRVRFRCDWFCFSSYEIYTLLVFLSGCEFLCRFIDWHSDVSVTHSTCDLFSQWWCFDAYVERLDFWLLLLLMLACTKFFGFLCFACVATNCYLFGIIPHLFYYSAFYRFPCHEK